MWFGEPHPFPEREPPTRLSNVRIIKLKRMIRLITKQIPYHHQQSVTTDNGLV